MKAVEVNASIDQNGNLILDEPIQTENNPDDTAIEDVKASLKRGFQQAKAGQTRPISELWSRIDAK